MFSNMGMGELILVLTIPAILVIGAILNKKDAGKGGGTKPPSTPQG